MAEETHGYVNRNVGTCVQTWRRDNAIKNGRAIKTRWALAWKPNEIDTNDALEKGAEQLLTKNAPTIGGRKPKARIVLLRPQHPELQSLQTTAATQCRKGRMCLLQCSGWRGVLIESRDATTGLLQTEGITEPERIDCPGVGASAIVLSADDPNAALKSFAHAAVLLRNRRVFHEDVKRRMLKPSATAMLTEPWAWQWAMTGHVYVLACCHVGGSVIATTAMTQRGLK